MKRHCVVVACGILSALFSCCTDMGDPPVGPQPTGSDDVEWRTVQIYSYLGYDADGTLVVWGTLRIAVDDSNIVSGTWDLSTAPGVPPNGLGPQVGKGNLAGLLDGNRVSIGLNPNFVDNNVFLSGTLSSTRITGTWEFVGFAGVLRRGTFVASRLMLARVSDTP
jgi:hypothetical protein